MIVFVDFEASSLKKKGFPIEIGWAAEDGSEASALIRPAPDWFEWSAEAQLVHGISREQLERDGEPHADLARRVVDALDGHALYASAPSWDGQWLSRWLRAANLPRHRLQLRATEEAQLLAAARLPDAAARALVAEVRAEFRTLPVAHRALEDARRELALWREIGRRAIAQS